MAIGLRQRDPLGNLLVDITTRLPRIMGRVEITAGQAGSVTVPVGGTNEIFYHFSMANPTSPSLRLPLFRSAGTQSVGHIPEAAVPPAALSTTAGTDDDGMCSHTEQRRLAHPDRSLMRKPGAEVQGQHHDLAAAEHCRGPSDVPIGGLQSAAAGDSVLNSVHRATTMSAERDDILVGTDLQREGGHDSILGFRHHRSRADGLRDE